MWVEILLLLAVLIAVFLFKIYHAQQYWQKLGVIVPDSVFPSGNNPFFKFKGFKKVAFQTASRNQYDKVKGKCQGFYGGYSFGQRFLVITDPDLAKDVMVKNFQSFIDRNGANSDAFLFHSGNVADEINLRQFVLLRGEAWKDARSTFTPIFTSGKIKSMFGLIRDTSDKLLDSLEEDAKKGKNVELKDKFGRFSMDTIASCAFGVDAGSFSETDSEFVAQAKSVFRFSAADIATFMALVFVPFMQNVFQALKISVAKPKPILFFNNVIRSTLEHRTKHKNRRNDIIDLILDMSKEENQDHHDSDEEDQFHKDGKLAHHRSHKKPVEELTMVASAMNLMVAGYDTTAQALSYLGYELAMDPDIQSRLQDEIDEIMEGKDLPSYEDILAMTYLDQAIHEILRMHPPLAMIQRGCTADYKIPNSDVWLRKGDEIFINVAGMHYDKDYFPEPHKFNPDNFTKEAKEKRHPYAFHGFGQGPRNCLGMRFALIEAKMGMARILNKYSFVKCAETPETTTIDPTSLLGAPNEGLFVKLEERQK